MLTAFMQICIHILHSFMCGHTQSMNSCSQFKALAKGQNITEIGMPFLLIMFCFLITTDIVYFMLIQQFHIVLVCLQGKK